VLATIRRGVAISAFTGEREAFVLSRARELVDARCGMMVRVGAAAADRQPRHIHLADAVGVEQWESGVLAWEPCPKAISRGQAIPPILRIIAPDSGQCLAIVHTSGEHPPDSIDERLVPSNGHTLCAVRKLERRGWIDVLALHRCPRDRTFAAYDRRLIELFWSEASWLCAPGPGVQGAGDGSPPPRHGKPLPPRLRQVLDALVRGNDSETIAEQLGISPHTVRDHIKRLYAELHVSNREQLITRCLTFDGDGIRRKAR